HCWTVGICRSGSIPPGAYSVHGGVWLSDWSSDLQLGGGATSAETGMMESSGFRSTVSRPLNGGLELSRLARLSWRSLGIPKPARTAHLPAPLGSQTKPTRGCQRERALFRMSGNFPISGSDTIKPLASNRTFE